MHLNSIHLIPAYHDVENHVYDEEEEDDQQEGDGSNMEERERESCRQKWNRQPLIFSNQLKVGSFQDRTLEGVIISQPA